MTECGVNTGQDRRRCGPSGWVEYGAHPVERCTTLNKKSAPYGKADNTKAGETIYGLAQYGYQIDTGELLKLNSRGIFFHIVETSNVHTIVGPILGTSVANRIMLQYHIP